MKDINDTIRQYRYLVQFVIKKYFPTKIEDEDIEQIGLIGLWKAAERYDKDSEGKFYNYAIKCIKNTILHELEKQSRDKRKANTIPQNIRLDSYTPDNKKNYYEVLKNETNDDFLRIIIRDYFLKLNPTQKKIFKLLSEGHTIKTISENVKMSVGYVHKQVTIMKNDIKELCYSEGENYVL